MKEAIIYTILLVAISGGAIVLFAIKLSAIGLFRYDKSNPYRRYCKKCGQQQDMYGCCMNCPGWWEDMVEIKDPACRCHDYTRN